MIHPSNFTHVSQLIFFIAWCRFNPRLQITCGIKCELLQFSSRALRHTTVLPCEKKFFRGMYLLWFRYLFDRFGEVRLCMYSLNVRLVSNDHQGNRTIVPYPYPHVLNVVVVAFFGLFSSCEWNQWSLNCLRQGWQRHLDKMSVGK